MYYLTFLIPLLLFVAAIKNYRAHRRLMGTGRIVDIHAAKNRYALYTTGAVFTLITLLFIVS